jgi:AraC family transcriptional activator of pobA
MSRETAEKLPFEIQTLEWIAGNRPEQWTEVRKSGGFEIVWIKEASGTCMIDLEKQAIRESMVYCIDAGQQHFFQPSKQMKGYYLSFSPQFLYLSKDNTWPLFQTKGYTQSGMARTIPVDDELQFEMEEIMGKMIKEFTHYSLLRSEIIRGFLKILMIYLTRRVETKKPERVINRNTELVRRFTALVENNLTRKKMVSDYASELSVTANYLNEVIKKHTGFTPNYHIQQRKVLEAKRQLICYGLSMKEIAYSLGFDDTAHFSKFFKVNTGSNFKKFKKGVQGWV